MADGAAVYFPLARLSDTQLRMHADIVYRGCQMLGEEMHEMVALGFVRLDVAGRQDRDSWTLDDLVFYELANDASPNADGRGEFTVNPSSIASVLNQASMDGLNGRQVMLWHTHTGTTAPSREDIAEFPDWLVPFGAVYYCPSPAMTLYNSRGIISNSQLPSNSIATPMDVPHG